MNRFVDFYESVLPQHSSSLAGRIGLMLGQAGYEVRVCGRQEQSLGYPHYVVTQPFNHKIFFNIGAKINWMMSVEKKTLKLTPIFPSSDGGEFFQGVVFPELGIQTLEFALPEPVVSLPVPDFVRTSEENWVRNTLYTPLMFKSEAQAVLKQYLKEVKKALQGKN